jgi:hypothetical protein
METNGISPFDQPEPKKNSSSRSAFLLGGLAALTLAGALGAGVVIGGRGGSGRSSAVEAAAVSPTRTLPVSPTASSPAPQNPQAGGQAPSGSGQPASNSGDTSGTGGAPAPTNTAEPLAATNTSEPAAPTNTPVPPTNTPTNTAVPPTNTPTNTPTATATSTAVPCPWCPIIDPVIIFPVLDIFPPVINPAHWSHCPGAYHFEFSVNESSEMWVTYIRIGIEFSTVHQVGMSYDADLAEGLFEPHDFVFHAKDSNGNEATMVDPPFFFCW